MVWQTEIETGRVVGIAFADEETVAPVTLPNTGSSLDWTAIASGENCFGWTINPFELTADDLEFEDNEGNPIIVKPPKAQKKRAIIRDEVDSPDKVTFTSFEIGAKVLAWATNVTIAGAVATKSPTFTRKALIVEIAGLGLHWFPSVEIRVATSKAGLKTIGTQVVIADVFGTDTYPTGHTWNQYEDV